MCSNCFSELDNLQPEINREFEGVQIYCAGMYENKLQKLIRGLKYHRQRDLAYYQAKFMYDYWQKIPDKKVFYDIIPVPLYKSREKSRKYNHMNLVAEEFSKLTGYGLNTDLIKRVKDTKPQYKLTKAQRIDNLANAFRVDKNDKNHHPILLIDDICTTGSTFESMISELKKAGIHDITCFATTTPNN